MGPGSRAEFVIGPRFARTRWHSAGMTKLGLLNLDSRLWADALQQPQQAAGFQSDAPRSGLETGPGDMDEDRAAAASHAGAGVVVDFYNGIIQVIRPP